MQSKLEKLKKLLYKQPKSVLIELVRLVKKSLEKETIKEMIRRVCREKGLSEDETNLIMAVIECESGFNPKAIGHNTDGTVDYGLCQYNSYWYIGKGVITKYEALNEPETCVRLMVDRYKEGWLKDWCCYKFGAYRRFL